ncbi:hypothetical protein BRD00_07165 [Halobacteriales archaeon QS_8_69_26]|nr:MAG: hypothetical protein BRD00_07165 [Halobacteriales archaeon QS_8_69_26]
MADAGDEFVVEVKQSAVRTNDAVGDRTTDRGSVWTFDAPEAARRLSDRGEGRVAVQRSTPQDDAVDAYLVAGPERRIREPDGSLDEGLTFDVSGNQYGALGEALVLAHPVNPPGITRYAREDALPDDRPGDDLRVVLDADPDPVAVRDAAGTRLTWVPDCRARALLDGRRVAEYVCGVKTGDASFERAQRTVMAATARIATVLAVRVDVEELPDSYAVRVREETASDPDEAHLLDGARDATLDEFG